MDEENLEEIMLEERELETEELDFEELDTTLLLSPEQPVNNAKQNPTIVTACLVAQYFLLEKNISIIPLGYLEG